MKRLKEVRGVKCEVRRGKGGLSDWCKRLNTVSRPPSMDHQHSPTLPHPSTLTFLLKPPHQPKLFPHLSSNQKFSISASSSRSSLSIWVSFLVRIDLGFFFFLFPLFTFSSLFYYIFTLKISASKLYHSQHAIPSRSHLTPSHPQIQNRFSISISQSTRPQSQIWFHSYTRSQLLENRRKPQSKLNLFLDFCVNLHEHEYDVRKRCDEWSWL